jgi:hypothetical protein
MNTKKLDLVDPKVAKEYPAPEKVVWVHEDIDIDMPSSCPDGVEFEIKNAYVLHYDGGCTKKLGTGGFVVQDPEGRYIGGQFKFYGDQKPTNNQAEAQALLDGLSWMVEHLEQVRQRVIVARGDS